MPCDPCTKPCERSGLLDVADEFRPRHSSDKNEPRLCTVSRCLCLLVAIAAITTVVMIFTTDSLTSMTPEKQIELLNSETEHAMSMSDVDLPSGCESTLILMRHCEYTEDGEGVQDTAGNEHCSDVGLRRAEYIPTLFGNESSAKWPLPKLLYAMSRERPGDEIVNAREIETLAPLGNKSGVQIDTFYSEGSERRLANDYFRHLAMAELCGQATVVNWKVNRIPIMAAALGCGTEEGCPEHYKKKEFDKVWKLEYTYFVNSTTSSRRGLKKKKKDAQDEPKKIGWNVKGKVIKERFESSVK